jgi:hypothetical protein
MNNIVIFMRRQLRSRQMSRKKSFLFFTAITLGMLMSSSQGLTAQEDTAKLTFTKQALTQKPLYTYTVQKGDILSAIVRRFPGISEKDIRVLPDDKRAQSGYRRSQQIARRTRIDPPGEARNRRLRQSFDTVNRKIP